ncbi:hypothetical protein ACFVAJ_17570 [Agromyces sp. NPDC057679]|uniref:hypothetical protein n=1 Tax=Agromyces sp. NPDC057679 TaxID=3346207 RepID=UPI00366ED7B9
MDVVSGAYTVTTSSGSRYLIDLDRSELSRMPRVAENVDPGFWEADDLRRDGETLQLLSIDELTVGRPAVFWLGDVADYPGYAGTRRTTTDVVDISQVAKLDVAELELALSGAASHGGED